MIFSIVSYFLVWCLYFPGQTGPEVRQLTSNNVDEEELILGTDYMAWISDGALICYDMVRESFIERKKDIPNVHIYLLKNIPVSAGLGGGSSNGATTILLLNKLFSLKMSISEMKAIADKLGSDCPFFINNEAAISSGRGEILAPAIIERAGLKIVIVVPNIEISTGWAYSQVAPSANISLPPLDNMTIDEWPDHLTNDFQSVAESEYPPIRIIREKLEDLGSIYSSLSGSGSSVFWSVQRIELY